MPAASTTYRRYVFAAVGARIEVAVPLAVVKLGPATKLVRYGANQTLPFTSFGLAIVTAVPPSMVSDAANKVFWVVGATVSTR